MNGFSEIKSIIIKTFTIISFVVLPIVAAAQTQPVDDERANITSVVDLLLSETAKVSGSPKLEFTSGGTLAFDTVSFENINGAGLDVTIQTDSAIDNSGFAALTSTYTDPYDFGTADPGEMVPGILPVAEGVVIAGFEYIDPTSPGPAFVTLTFSEAVKLQDLTIVIGKGSPTLAVVNFSSPVVGTSFGGGGNSFQWNNLDSDLDPLVFSFDETVNSLSFGYSGSPGSVLLIESISVAP